MARGRFQHCPPISVRDICHGLFLLLELYAVLDPDGRLIDPAQATPVRRRPSSGADDSSEAPETIEYCGSSGIGSVTARSLANNFSPRGAAAERVAVWHGDISATLNDDSAIRRVASGNDLPHASCQAAIRALEASDRGPGSARQRAGGRSPAAVAAASTTAAATATADPSSALHQRAERAEAT